jgi:hypothetical protein
VQLLQFACQKYTGPKTIRNVMNSLIPIPTFLNGLVMAPAQSPNAGLGLSLYLPGDDSQGQNGGSRSSNSLIDWL